MSGMRTFLALPVLALPLAALAAPAAADDFCGDFWFTRNLLMDRAGHCFGSPLGRALFDNEGCTEGAAPGPEAAARIARIQAAEKRNACKVDVSAETLGLDDADIRRRLTDLPLRDEIESSCIGWEGAVTPLLAGRRPQEAAVGRISPGDHVLYQHVPEEGWVYVTARDRKGALISGGWMKETLPAPCRDFAG